MSNTYYLVQPEAGLLGPFALIQENVSLVAELPGVYILAERGTSNNPIACYVGRSGNLRRRLGEHLGEYGLFFVKYTDTEVGAYFLECRWFHKYGKAAFLDNEIHPAAPFGLPACGEPGCLGETY